MIKMRAPEGVTAVSHDGKEYTVSDAGIIDAEDHHAPALTELGFAEPGDELPAVPRKTRASKVAEAQAE